MEIRLNSSYAYLALEKLLKSEGVNFNSTGPNSSMQVVVIAEPSEVTITPLDGKTFIIAARKKRMFVTCVDYIILKT